MQKHFHRMVEQHLWKPRKNTNLAQSGFKAGINLMEGTKIVIFLISGFAFNYFSTL
jgi:hypothetical protein